MPLVTADELLDRLEAAGELHVTLASGGEGHLHKHDVDADGETIVIDSRAGFWEFAAGEIEAIERPDSHYDAP